MEEREGSSDLLSLCVGHNKRGAFVKCRMLWFM
jgi:hypothetical protein